LDISLRSSKANATKGPLVSSIIPEKLETFMEGLHEFFRSGAHMIEQSILKESHTNLGLKYKSREDYRFIDYVDDLENLYQAIKNPPKSKWLQRALPKT